MNEPKCPTCNGTGVNHMFRDNICPDCKGTKVAFPLLALVGTVVGKVKVNKPVERDDRGFECAAWWEKSVSDTGVYDIVLVRDHHNRNKFYFAASVPATITEDYFPALFCGNLIGEPYDTKSRAGQKARNIALVKDLVKGCTEASSSFDDAAQKWAVEPRVWQAVVDYYKSQSDDYGDYVANCLTKWRLEGDGEYFEHLGQLGWVGERVAEYSRGAEEVMREIKFRNENLDRGTDYFEKNNPFLRG